MNEARAARRRAASPCLTAIISLVLLSIVASSACFSSPNPNLYALYPQAGAKRGARALRVELRRPSVPAYLDRPQLVRRVGLGRLELAGNDWWGSPFGEMVGTTLAMNLSARLPNSTVYTGAVTMSTQPDVVVELQIQRFEPTHRGSVELLAQVALHFPDASKGTIITRHELTARIEDDSAAVVVKVMSLLLAELSDEIAQSIAQRAPPHRGFGEGQHAPQCPQDRCQRPVASAVNSSSTIPSNACPTPNCVDDGLRPRAACGRR